MSESSLPAAWRLIVTEPMDGADNMALDSALLDELEGRLAAGEAVAPILRLSSWAPAAVSVGRNQALGAACDLAACRAAGVDVVRRATGGRGVLHEDEITYAVVAPASGPFEGAGVTRASAVIADALVRGLRDLGVDARSARGVAPGSPRAGREACFAATSRCEVVVDGRKLCGSAQRRGRLAFLQHGSLPLTFDAHRHAALLACDAASLHAKAVGLAECLGQAPSPERVRSALVSGFGVELGAHLVASGLTEAETARWDALAAELRGDAECWAPAIASRSVACSA